MDTAAWDIEAQNGLSSSPGLRSINMATGSVSPRLEIPRTIAVTLSADAQTLFVRSQGQSDNPFGEVWIVDVGSRTVKATIPAGSSHARDPSGVDTTTPSLKASYPLTKSIIAGRMSAGEPLDSWGAEGATLPRISQAPYRCHQATLESQDSFLRPRCKPRKRGEALRYR